VIAPGVGEIVASSCRASQRVGVNWPWKRNSREYREMQPIPVVERMIGRDLTFRLVDDTPKLFSWVPLS
jgi:hypothetical protein